MGWIVAGLALAVVFMAVLAVKAIMLLARTMAAGATEPGRRGARWR
jgi:hypothetical protein